MHNIIWLRKSFKSLFCFNKPLVYFDNASTTQKPLFLLDVFKHINYGVCTNPGRGQYYTSFLLSNLLNKSRDYIKHIYSKQGNYECIIYKSVTEAINAIYNNYWFIGKKVKVLTCIDNHHSIIAPVYGKLNVFTLNVIGLDSDLIPNVRQYLNYIKNSISIVILNHMSNVIGILVPIRLYSYIKKYTITFIVDGSQSAPHFEVDIELINCDAYLLSSHKSYAFVGTGICLGKQHFINDLNPLILGGGGVHKISFNPFNCLLNGIPDKHESGSPMVWGIVGLTELIK